MRTSTLLVIALLAVGSPGCGGPESDFCGAKCDCERCSDADYDHCLAEYDDRARTADRRDCLDDYDAFVSCQADTATCHGGDIETDCGPEKKRYDDCVK